MVKGRGVSKSNKKRTLKRGGKRSLRKSNKKTQKRKSSKRSVRNTKGKNLRGGDQGEDCNPNIPGCLPNKRGQCQTQCKSNECCYVWSPSRKYCSANC